ncbi:hypothetical protein AGLY_005503 [Aphis glycines]|uniref:Uncharacterized protein n=1 Tax=Aphis glycines TaxID=307491 RepID=A0A6G0TUB4_APHGL|nr:hypothetical protein AGLY_005503 [Aphis glycines]
MSPKSKFSYAPISSNLTFGTFKFLKKGARLITNNQDTVNRSPANLEKLASGSDIGKITIFCDIPNQCFKVLKIIVKTIPCSSMIQDRLNAVYLNIDPQIEFFLKQPKIINKYPAVLTKNNLCIEYFTLGKLFNRILVKKPSYNAYIFGNECSIVRSLIKKKIVPGIQQQIQSLQLVGGNTCQALQTAIASSFSSSSSLAVKSNLFFAKSVIFKPYTITPIETQEPSEVPDHQSRIHCESFMLSYTLFELPGNLTDALKTSGN